jgi:hypothetical protein
LPSARELPASGIAIENSSFWSQEFQSLIARAAAASSAACTGATHGTVVIPQKDRCSMTMETLTND